MFEHYTCSIIWKYHKNEERNIIQMPSSIIAYNHNMGGVNVVDQQ